MRLGVAATAGIVIVGIIVAAAVISSVVGGYARETTGIQDRWSGSTVAERDCAYGIPAQQLAGIATPDANPCAITADDRDGDGIPNDAEAGYGTNPDKADTDGDGWSDGAEIILGTDPTKASSHPAFENNVSTSTAHPVLNGSRDNPNDHDNDGLSNAQEAVLGTDPTNPDTDGDGVSDGAEVAKGTNPKDPTDGGLQSPPPTIGPYHTPELILTQLYKVGRDSYSGGQWSHVVAARIGDSIEFNIHAEAFNENEGGTHTLVIEDTLPSGLTYQSGTTTNGADANHATVPLTYDQLRHTEIIISAPGTATVDFTFTALANSIGNFENDVTMFEVGHTAQLIDKAFVIIHSLDPNDIIGGGFGQVCVICNLHKEGRAPGTDTWDSYVKANSGDRIEFRISLETSTDPSGRPININVADTLPAGMTYVSRSSHLFKNGQEQTAPADNWLTTGMSLNSDAARVTFEITFSAKVEAALPFSLTNTVRAESGGAQPNSRIATTQVVSKP